MSNYKICILSDEESWINYYLKHLVKEWVNKKHQVFWAHDSSNLPVADFCFCLSYSKILSQNSRENFSHTLVVHASDLPRGKGWSPLTWQILEGRNDIPVTLFEASDEIDSGAIYLKSFIHFEGNELIDELRQKLAGATTQLCTEFIDHYPQSVKYPQKQSGKESFYTRRCPEDSELNPHKSIADQFNLLRVVDNDRYPLFFNFKGKIFKLKIFDE